VRRLQAVRASQSRLLAEEQALTDRRRQSLDVLRSQAYVARVRSLSTPRRARTPSNNSEIKALQTSDSKMWNGGISSHSSSRSHSGDVRCSEDVLFSSEDVSNADTAMLFSPFCYGCKLLFVAL
jgi:hypothetical protein